MEVDISARAALETVLLIVRFPLFCGGAVSLPSPASSCIISHEADDNAFTHLPQRESVGHVHLYLIQQHAHNAIS